MRIPKWIAMVALCGLLVPFIGASGSGCDDNSRGTQRTEQKQTEENQQRLISATPPPQFSESLERQNLSTRLKTLNVQNKVGYVYLMGFGGEVVANYTVRGKVSSLNSWLTSPEQIVTRNLAGKDEGFVVESPDFDGSYGKNPEGIFFFTTDGTYVEWAGQYLYADKPLKIMTPVKLRATVDLEKHG